MNSEFNIQKRIWIKTISLSIFFLLSFVITSSYLIQSNLKDDCSIEKTSELEEKESENESEEEFDDEFDEYIFFKNHSKSDISEFIKVEFWYFNNISLHFGDTFTPPPDLI